MRRFKKRPEVGFIVLPGLGRITDNSRIFEGDQFAKFCPSVLVELPADELPAPRKSAPPPAVIIPPPPPPPPAHMPDPMADTVETPVHVPPEAIPPKNEAFPTIEEVKAAVEQENRETEAQIEKVVESIVPDSEKTEPVKEEPKKKHHDAPKKTGSKKTQGKK
jgi:hypothetical protein